MNSKIFKNFIQNCNLFEYCKLSNCFPRKSLSVCFLKTFSSQLNLKCLKLKKILQNNILKFFYSDRILVHVCEINPALHEKNVWVRGRLHTSRGTGRQCFVVIRDQQATIQALVFVGESVSKQMVKFCARYQKS